MRLYITEKPSAARQLIDALGECRHVRSSNGTKFGGHKAGNGWCVTWLSGYFHRLYEPHDYDPALKRWSMSTLPILHTEPVWKVDDSPNFPPKHEIEEQIEHIQGLYAQADEVILATDADQEGQVIGQVFLEQTGWTGPVKRLWSDLWEVQGLREALGKLRDNREFRGMYEAGLSRIICDQMIGINFTRLLTLKAEQAGYSFMANSGRVRSPCTKYVVDHQAKVDAHSARAYYNLRANLQRESESFQARLILPSSLLEDGEHCFDPEPIRRIQASLSQETHGIVESVTRSQQEHKPPLPFNQNTLSQYCAQHHSMMPDETEAAAQKLYEQGYLSYPRVESKAYETSVLLKVPSIFQMLAGLSPEFTQAVSLANIEHPQPVFVDEGVDAHGAIFPSPTAPNISALSAHQKAVYLAVANRLLAQFYPNHITSNDKVILLIGNHRFMAESSGIVQPGWTSLVPTEDKEKTHLPALNQGDQCPLRELQLQERKTKAPSRLTVSAFQAMLEDCTHLLSEPVRQRMGSARGQLGTGATQKTYLKELVAQRVAVVEDKKYVVPTRRGIELARLLPDTLSSPDLSSLWEMHFRAIRKGQKTRQEFVGAVADWVRTQVEQVKALSFPPSPTINACERCSSAMIRRPRRGEPTQFYWQCSNEECRTTTPDLGGKPLELHPKDGEPCPKCESALRTKMRRKDRARFLGCSNRECKHNED
ncbi:DNA topoisomerase [Marinimicrobium sp. ABcell2]|uniref:DNA topoisomerase n=1 Tax=Marinimicrobium sp. ABcell2 TaxID=3069751 RepID=UPI0027B6EC2B|nr:DNA topoisomerase [Marinimicrobium sp. ABcell2]MDQ2077539.1 DNA topoisomerase [Marinimicrobium sp. ABcell2]